MWVFFFPFVAHHERLGQRHAIVNGRRRVLIDGIQTIVRRAPEGQLPSVCARYFFHCVTTLYGSRMTISKPLRCKYSAVSKAFSPFGSMQTKLSLVVNKKGKIHDTPLPDLVGAKTV